jgi:hypothetical protein
MKRKWPGKICRKGQFRRRAGLIPDPVHAILYSKINILIPNAGLARGSHS